MIDTASPTAPAPTDSAGDRAGGCGAAEGRAERHLRVLQELVEIGMDLARTVQRQAHEQAAAGASSSAADLGLVFSRIARAVRQTVALEARLAEDRQQARVERAPLSVADRWRSARRKREVKEIVSHAIDVGVSGYDAERLFGDLDERLEDGEDDADFADRPIGELVARICRDLGIAPDWSLWEDEDWAIEEARTQAPGSPYGARPSDGDEVVAAGDPDDDPPRLSPKPPWLAH